MSNMSYCRFENTSSDLMDCSEHIHDIDLLMDEIEHRDILIELCIKIVEDAGHQVVRCDEDVCKTCQYPQSDCECE